MKTREQIRLERFQEDGIVLIHEWEASYDYRYRALAVRVGLQTHIVYEVLTPQMEEWQPVDTLKNDPPYSQFARIIAKQLADELITSVYRMAEDAVTVEA